MKAQNFIEITGARQHNLKNIDVKIPKPGFTVVTGPSGSGKSSLAFNTIFAEGQRRYMESLSSYARQFLDKHEKPDIDDIKNICPTIAIEQKNHTKSSRSTVGTSTEIYDYLRLLFAKAGQMYCPKTKKAVKKDYPSEVARNILNKYKEKKAVICFPIDISPQSEQSDRENLLKSFLEMGFTKAILPAEIKLKKKTNFYDLQDELAKENSPILGYKKLIHCLYLMTDRLKVSEETQGRIEDAISSSYSNGHGRARCLLLNEKNILLEEIKVTEFPSVNGGEERFPELSPLLFSFNSPIGACPCCNGYGATQEINQELVIPNPELSLSQGCIEPLSKPSSKEWLKEVLIFCKEENISLNLPWNALPKEHKDKIWDGHKDFEGILGIFTRLEKDRFKLQVRVFLSRYRSPILCVECNGDKLRAESLAVKIDQFNISQLSTMSIQNLHEALNSIELTPEQKVISSEIYPQIANRVDFLIRVGLGYLSLNRLAKTLSGGEAQRIALANQLGSRLTQTCYVLDEPSIGLHPEDTEKLIGILKELHQLNNAVIVVEHDPDIIKSAEYLVDIGPEAGENGGEVLFQGDYNDFLKADLKESTTWNFLNEHEQVKAPLKRRLQRHQEIGKETQWVEIKGCREHNLQDVDLKIPLNTLTAITGVSGSGKSTAVRKTLYPALARLLRNKSEMPGEYDEIKNYEALKSVILINQDPIGRSPRSNPITYLKAYDEIRNLYASLSESKRRKYHPGYFSFNVPGGRCTNCEGDGHEKVEMLFMEDLYLKCEHCDGKRFKKETLEVEYRGKNISDVLNMTAKEALEFFKEQKKLKKYLSILNKVGLGYIRIGQPATTLSGGECQRLKIARELTNSERTNIMYILDEPTTGLHFRDVKVLSKVLHFLVEKGNTCVVIEHNMDLIKSSDYVIDFGPGGGVHGGKIVCQGDPDELIQEKKLSVTMKHLKKSLDATERVSIKDFFENS